MPKPICRKCGREFSSSTHLRSGLCSKCTSKTDGQTGDAISNIIVTTESASDLVIAERLGVVTAECVAGMHLFKDLFAGLSDVFGGRSQTMQSELRKLRQKAIEDLKREAFSVGADAVVAVDLDYSEISGGGKSMLFLVASGTAVRLQKSV